MREFGKFSFAILIFAVGLFISGVTIDLFWDWFIAPVFGLQGLWFSQAVGLSMVVALLKTKVIKKDEDSDSDLDVERITKAFTLQAILLLIGYVVSFFM